MSDVKEDFVVVPRGSNILWARHVVRLAGSERLASPSGIIQKENVYSDNLQGDGVPTPRKWRVVT